jgi:hypothetical protein
MTHRTLATHRVARPRLRDALRSTAGAIDLASIMIGVIVIGVIAGVIAATVFAVIPWAQDRAANASLDAVKTAESVSYTMQTSATGAGRYSSSSQLKTDGYLPPSKTVIVFGNTTVYKAFSLSATGAVFYQTSASPTVITRYANLTDANNDQFLSLQVDPATGALVNAP